jgi:hypothetical protein
VKKQITFLIMAVLLSGCKKADYPSPVPATNDEALRTFMGIRSIDAHFTLSDSAIGYYPVVIEPRKTGPE